MSASQTLADQFAWLIQRLFTALAFEGRRLGIEHAVQAAISQRMVGLWKQLRSAFARWRAGTLVPPRPRAAGERTEGTPHPGLDPLRGSSPQGGREQKTGEAHWSRVLPRGFGWVKRLMPDIAYHMNAFQHLLDDPELKAMLAASPQVRRIVRAFCHFLGLELPPELALPKRVRVRTNNPSPRPSPARGEGEESGKGRPLTPREKAEAAERRSLATGKPIDMRKLSRVTFGYLVHPPRDGHCPPPEIGYARPRPLPRDYRPDSENDE